MEQRLERVPVSKETEGCEIADREHGDQGQGIPIHEALHGLEG
jgi:hypothetical protein